MSFQIVEIVAVQPEGIRAVVAHADQQIPAVIVGSKAEDLTIGKIFRATIGYDEIRNGQVVSDFEDARSGIWQEPDGIHLLGRVHNLLDYGDGKTIVDVYMQNGPELFSVDADRIEEMPGASDGLEIIVGQLYIYPQES